MLLAGVESGLWVWPPLMCFIHFGVCEYGPLVPLTRCGQQPDWAPPARFIGKIARLGKTVFLENLEKWNWNVLFVSVYSFLFFISCF